MKTTNMPIKLVFFSSCVYALASGKSSGFGGAELDLWNVAQEIATDSRFAVSIVTVTAEISTETVINGVRFIPVHPGEKLTYDHSWLKRRKVVFGFFARLYKVLKAQQADILYAKLASWEAVVAYYAAKASGAKYVYRVEHDWEVSRQTLIDKIYRGSVFAADRFISALSKADWIIVQSRFQAEGVRSTFRHDSTLIPNGHFLPNLTDENREAGSRKFVLWIARAHPMKRPALFLDLAKELPQVRFVMVMPPGAAHSELFESIRTEAEKIPNLEFIPGLKQADVDAYYVQAKAFVLTSEAEGFSNVIIEAFKNGTPVVSLTHNPNEVLTPVEAGELAPQVGYCAQSDFSVMARTVEKLWEDDEFWTEASQTARQYAVDNFSVESVADIYKKQFFSMLNLGFNDRFGRLA